MKRIYIQFNPSIFTEEDVNQGGPIVHANAPMLYIVLGFDDDKVPAEQEVRVNVALALKDLGRWLLHGGIHEGVDNSERFTETVNEYAGIALAKLTEA